MARANSSDNDVSFFNLPHAKWVVGVLSMAIAVVGKDSLLGLILRQTRAEINSLIQDESPASAATQFQNN